MQTWSEALSIGIETIDEQHKNLFKIFSDLQNAIEHGKGEADIGKVLEFLGDYVITHFNTEEEYMTKHAYPEYETHRAQHEKFSEEFLIKKREFLMQGEKIKTDIVVWLYFWYRKHILAVDKNLCDFLKKKGITS